jgi:hypothetical protein
MSSPVWRPGKGTSIIQWGTPRLGTTFQYTLLCLIVKMKHMPNENNVRCDEMGSPTRNIGPDMVMKTHYRPHPVNFTNYLLFTAARSSDPVWNGSAYQQQYGQFLAAPLEEVKRYQPIFNLTAKEVHSAMAYMRYWSIIRRCCGSQQSLVNRQRLHGCKPSEPITSPQYPACETYNLTAVEELLHRLPGYQLFPFYPRMESSHGVGRPHYVGYCAETEHKIVEERKDFNL